MRRTAQLLCRTFASPADNSPSASGPRRARGASPHEIRADRSSPINPTSSILDSIDNPPTPQTAAIEDRLSSFAHETQSIRDSVNSHISARLLSLGDFDPDSSPTTSTEQAQLSPDDPKSLPPVEAISLAQLTLLRARRREELNIGTNSSPAYTPLAHLWNPPSPFQVTLPMLLAAQSHLGHHTSLWNPRNGAYIFGIRDGIHIISLDTTYAYLQRAAKVIREIARRGGIILFVGTRDGQEDTVVNAAKRAGAYHVFDRWTPGSLTNGQQILGHCPVKVVDVLDREVPKYKAMMAQSAASASHPVLRPDLVVCLNPLENEVCLHECGLYNVPTIGIIDTDADASWVTYPIPANDDSLRCVMLIAGVLGRAGEEGQIARMSEATRGRATYDVKPAERFLKGLEELSQLNVQDNRGMEAEK